LTGQYSFFHNTQSGLARKGKTTPICTLRNGLFRLVTKLNGVKAEAICDEMIDKFGRYLAGDSRLISEMRANAKSECSQALLMREAIPAARMDDVHAGDKRGLTVVSFDTIEKLFEMKCESSMKMAKYSRTVALNDRKKELEMLDQKNKKELEMLDQQKKKELEMLEKQKMLELRFDRERIDMEIGKKEREVRLEKEKQDNEYHHKQRMLLLSVGGGDISAPYTVAKVAGYYKLLPHDMDGKWQDKVLCVAGRLLRSKYLAAPMPVKVRDERGYEVYHYAVEAIPLVKKAVEDAVMDIRRQMSDGQDQCVEKQEEAPAAAGMPSSGMQTLDNWFKVTEILAKK
jgi:hypothetical protein